VELTSKTAYTYLRHAFAGLGEVVDQLGDDRVNVAPPGPATNSAASLVVHCCGVTKFWLGHVALGRPSTRDRDAEFSATATVAELQSLMTATAAQAKDDLIAMGRGPTSDPSTRPPLWDDEPSDASLG
jgi:hypothetical protein